MNGEFAMVEFVLRPLTFFLPSFCALSPSSGCCMTNGQRGPENSSQRDLASCNLHHALSQSAMLK